MTGKILVADDSVTIQRVVSLAFTDEDVQVEAVSSGDLAVERARTFHPDVIFADVFMPGLSGYEVCRSIKGDPALSACKVVLMVGTFERYDPDEAVGAGCDGCLTKPFDTSELLQTYRSLIIHRPGGLDAPAGATCPEPRGLTALAARTRPWFLSPKARTSFVGEGRILDLFSEDLLGRMKSAEQPRRKPLAPGSGAVGPIQGGPAPQSPVAQIPPETLRALVEDAVKRLAPDIIREIAWEVVPELSEGIVREIAGRSASARGSSVPE